MKKWRLVLISCFLTSCNYTSVSHKTEDDSTQLFVDSAEVASSKDETQEKHDKKHSDSLNRSAMEYLRKLGNGEIGVAPAHIQYKYDSQLNSTAYIKINNNTDKKVIAIRFNLTSENCMKSFPFKSKIEIEKHKSHTFLINVKDNRCDDYRVEDLYYIDEDGKYRYGY